MNNHHPSILNHRPIVFVLVLFLNSLPATSGTDKKSDPIARVSCVDFTSSNLPIIVIDTFGRQIPDRDRIIAHMGVIDNETGARNNVTDPFNNFDGRITIEIRGSSSTQWPKKQYGFETQDSLGNNLNVSLLGMPEENDWILYAPYSDKSLMRNVLSYYLSNQMGRYASRTHYCEVVLNGDYQGVYVLMEKIKRDKSRVDISTLNPDEISGDDITGGYILKIDKLAGENIGGWKSSLPTFINNPIRIYYQYHYPKPDEIVPEQAEYIQTFIYDFEVTMFSRNYADPENGYSKFINTESFVDCFIISEFARNVDAYRLSAFMTKDKDSINGKLSMGPIWDYNFTFGNADYYDAWLTEGWQLDYFGKSPVFRNSDQFYAPFWWHKLLRDEAFFKTVQSRWNQLRISIMETGSLHDWIDDTAALLDESSKRNFQRWPVLGIYIWPNAFIGSTYGEEVLYLKQWVADRAAWMDQALSGNSSIENGSGNQGIPEIGFLSQNHPNPFNMQTKLSFGNTDRAHVKIIIFDILGHEVTVLVDCEKEAGVHDIIWSGKDAAGHAVPSGVYWLDMTVRLEDRVFRQTRKAILLR